MGSENHISSHTSLCHWPLATSPPACCLHSICSLRGHKNKHLECDQTDSASCLVQVKESAHSWLQVIPSDLCVLKSSRAGWSLNEMQRGCYDGVEVCTALTSPLLQIVWVCVCECEKSLYDCVLYKRLPHPLLVLPLVCVRACVFAYFGGGRMREEMNDSDAALHLFFW